jgi:hypothetical protein
LRKKDRARRIARLRDAQTAEREGEKDDTVGVVPTVPRGLEIPLKPHREGAEPVADLADEFFGGFAREDADEPERQRRPRRPRGCPRYTIPGCGWERAVVFGWAAIPQRYPDSARKNRKGAPKSWNGVSSFPRRIGASAPRRWVADEVPREPVEVRGGQWSRSPADDLSLDWMLHTTSRRRPSRALEAKRFPRLPKIETKLLPNAAPGKGARKLAARALAEELTKGVAVTACPAGWSSCELESIIEKYENRKRPGRPPLGKSAMPPAERKRRQRQKLKLIETPPPTPPGDQIVDDTSEAHASELDRSLGRTGRSARS